jgi:polyhydroxybutyrate depolymerase
MNFSVWNSGFDLFVALLSVLHIHGTADTRIPYAGGEGTGSAHIDGPPVGQVVASWRAVDACAQPSTAVSSPITTSTAQCPGGRAVELITISGAGHQWPGSPAKPAEEARSDWIRRRTR